MHANTEKLTFVIENHDFETGDLWYEASPTPRRSHSGTVRVKTLGIGKLDTTGRIKPLHRNEIDKETLYSFLRQTNQLLKVA